MSDTAPAPTIESELAAHASALAAFLARATGVSSAAWRTPRAPEKWSPAQEAAHLSRTYSAFSAVLRGGPPLALCIPPARTDDLRATLLPAILAGAGFPRPARAPAETVPAEDPGEQPPVLLGLREAAAAFAVAVRSAATEAPERAIVHPYFGPLPLPDLLRLLTAHVQHHAQYLPTLERTGHPGPSDPA